MATPPRRPGQVPALVVTPASIRSCGSQLLAASAQVDDTGSFASSGARVAEWQGDGASTYREAVRPIGRQADAMSLALRGVAHRVDAHADEMTDLLTGRVDLESRRQHLAQQVAHLEGETALPHPPAEDALLQEDCTRVQREVDVLDADVASWWRAVTVEETAMVEAFTRVQDLDDVDRLLGGAVDPADEALDRRPPGGAPPEAVHAWWAGLTLLQRQAVIAAAPGAVGNLDGIPARDRHAANTVRLDRDLADWEHTEREGVLSDDERRWLDNAHAARDAVEEVGGRLDPVTGLPVETQIYLYDPAAFGGDGRIAISAGDLDTADNVAVVTPGLGTDATSAVHQASRAATLYESTRYLDPAATNATLAWIGYDAPDNVPVVDGLRGDWLGVAGEGLAADGGARLSDTIDGLRASRDGDPAHLTAIGHSYGSTTTGHGASGDGLDVDDIVLVGSPGVGEAEHASDLGIDPDHVWAGANSHDLVANLGNHGSFHLETFGGAGLGDDPVEDDFGGQRFEAESTTRGDGLDPLSDHNKYFDHDTESLFNISSVVNGDYDDVQHADHLHDPWHSAPVDPEYDRVPGAPPTRRP